MESKQEILEKLRKLDRRLEGEQVDVFLIGSSVIMLKEIKKAIATHDIDVVLLKDDFKKYSDLFHEVESIDIRASYFREEMEQLGWPFEEYNDYAFLNMKLYILDNEALALMKANAWAQRAQFKDRWFLEDDEYVSRLDLDKLQSYLDKWKGYIDDIYIEEIKGVFEENGIRLK